MNEKQCFTEEFFMTQIKTLVKQHIYYYLTGAVVLLAMKLFAEGADADTLRFLLAPVAGLVSLTCGAPFLWEPHAGYVSHDLRFLIAASCSGINFMMITVGMLFFSFLHRISVHKTLRLLWLPISLILAYFYTILTNTVRILIAIYLPLYLEKQSLLPALLSHDTLHTLIGTVVYFSSLLILYSWTDKSTNRLMCSFGKGFTAEADSMLHGYLALMPLFWYVGIIWGLPLLSRILQGSFSGFGGYTLLVLGSCITLSLFSSLGK